MEVHWRGSLEKNREIDLIRVEISMATKPEKVVYNITLQSEEDEEVKVIDRLHPRGLQLKAFLTILKLVPAWTRCQGRERFAVGSRRAAARPARRVPKWLPESLPPSRLREARSALIAAVCLSGKSETYLSDARLIAPMQCRKTCLRCGSGCVVVAVAVGDAKKATTWRTWKK